MGKVPMEILLSEASSAFSSGMPGNSSGFSIGDPTSSVAFSLSLFGEALDLVSPTVAFGSNQAPFKITNNIDD